MTAVQALRSVLPAGTLSGAPKVRAMEIIDELEPVKRGAYGGAVGWLSYAGQLDTCICIRTVVVKDGAAHVQAGGGTVADARPDYEYEESRAKARGVVRAIELAAAAGGLAVRVLVVDNYDSFTYNLVQYLGELGAEVEAVRNDAASVEELLGRGFDRVVVSPGPCTPAEAGISVEVMRRFPEAGVPALGVCLGHQSLAQAFGGRVVRHVPVHGKATEIEHDGRGLFAGLPSPLIVGRYHSLVVDPELPDCLERDRARRRRADGHAPPRAAGRGRPVPPRVGAHARRQAAAGELPCLTRSSRGRSTRWPRAATSRPTRRRRCWPRSWTATRPRSRRPACSSRCGRRARRSRSWSAWRRPCAASRRRSITGRDDLIDTAGTGGGRPTFNVSTTAALIAAGAGCAVAKHGNRSATGLSGSADVLEALGVRIDLAPDAVARCIEEVGFGFMFAPAHHGATRFVVPVRKELAVRTIFNFLGPLTNPAGATRQVIGVSDPAFLDTIAGALARLGARKALVVSSADGLDEMSTSGTTRVVEVDGAELRRYEVAPEDVGLAARAARRRCPAARRTPTRATARRILAGEPGPQRDLALLNAGRRHLRLRPRRTRSRRASARPPRPSTPGAPPPRSTRWPRSPGSWRRLDERARPHRRGHARARCGRRRERVPLARLEAALGRPPGRAARSRRRSPAPASR